MAVAVIGAGYAGLAAAVELAGRGLPVTVFESARAPGGRAREVRRDGRVLDNGQHILAGAYERTLALLRQIGVDPEQALLRMPLTLHYPGRLRLRAARAPAPWHLALGLIGARGMPWLERVRAAAFVRALSRPAVEIPRDMSVSELLARHKQSGVTRELVWEAICLAALNTPAHEASAPIFAAVLRDTLGATRDASDLLLPRVSLSELVPAPAIRFIREKGGTVRFDCPIASIARGAARYTLIGDRSGAGYDAVIAAVPPYRLPGLLAGIDEAAAVAALAGGLHYQAIVTCYLEYPRAVCLPAAMIGCARGPIQWYFDQAALGGPVGRIAAVVSAAADIARTGRAAIVADAHLELTRIVGNLPPPKWSFVLAEKRATFSCVAGVSRPNTESGARGIYLAGDYVASPYPGTIEAAVRSGQAAARAAWSSMAG